MSETGASGGPVWSLRIDHPLATVLASSAERVWRTRLRTGLACCRDDPSGGGLEHHPGFRNRFPDSVIPACARPLRKPHPLISSGRSLSAGRRTDHGTGHFMAPPPPLAPALHRLHICACPGGGQAQPGGADAPLFRAECTAVSQRCSLRGDLVTAGRDAGRRGHDRRQENSV